MCGLSLVDVGGGRSSLPCAGFSLQRLLLLGSTGSVVVAHGLSCPVGHVGSSWTRDGTHVPGVARQSLNHRATREAQMSALYGNSGSLPALGDGRAGAGSSAMKPHM